MFKTVNEIIIEAEPKPLDYRVIALDLAVAAAEQINHADAKDVMEIADNFYKWLTKVEKQNAAETK